MNKVHTAEGLFYGQMMYNKLNGHITEVTSQKNNGLTVNVIELSDLKMDGRFSGMMTICQGHNSPNV